MSDCCRSTLSHGPIFSILLSLKLFSYDRSTVTFELQFTLNFNKHQYLQPRLCIKAIQNIEIYLTLTLAFNLKLEKVTSKRKCNGTLGTFMNTGIMLCMYVYLAHNKAIICVIPRRQICFCAFHCSSVQYAPIFGVTFFYIKTGLEFYHDLYGKGKRLEEIYSACKVIQWCM